MENYRKNKNFFDFTVEKPSKKECLVTSKVGVQDATPEFTQNNSNDKLKARPQKVIDGEEVSNSVLENYVENLKYFARHKRGNTSYQSLYSSKKQSSTGAGVKSIKRSSIAQQAEQQRLSRLRQRIGAVPLNVFWAVKSRRV
eukprot:TRINITY_DN3824_c0_g1_i7.p1 TRINITY_DN3824_c0_g1~~TRINITY_DN3824_c0_g1_i7.p1  ORF type:complete len:142 (-),score=22.47 TRINITY_DN3824_c0_g1_i7:182-607(-)